MPVVIHAGGPLRFLTQCRLTQTGMIKLLIRLKIGGISILYFLTLEA